MMMSPKKSVIP